MNRKTLIILFAVLVCCFGVLGCVSAQPETVNAPVKEKPTYEYTTILCPNPDCPLHTNPYYSTGNYVLTIEMSTWSGSGGYALFHCQYCGACWSQHVT